MKKQLFIIILMSQLTLACLAKDNLALKKLKVRQIETPVYYAQIHREKQSNTHQTPKLRQKKYYNHKKAVSIFDYDVDIDSQNKGVTQKELSTSLKPIEFPQNSGELTLGSSYYGSENKEKDTQSNTYNLYSEYELGKFSFQTKYSRYTQRDFENPNDNMYFIPRFELTRNLALKLQHKKRVRSQNYKNEFILEYALDDNPILEIDNMSLELNASYINNENQPQQKQLGAKAKYYF